MKKNHQSHSRSGYALLLPLFFICLSLFATSNIYGQACTYLSPVVQVQSTPAPHDTTINNQPYCVTTVYLTTDIQINGGNKWTYVHVWKASEYQTFNYSSGSPTEDNVLANDVFTFVLYNNGTDLAMMNTYNPDTDADGEVITEADGIQVSRVPTSIANVYTYTFSNIKLLTPGDCSDVYNFLADSWASNADNGDVVHCSNTGILINLPVDFGPIKAIARDGSLEVDWTTLTENNNKGFSVQGSIDGQNWTTIGKLESKAANGTSASPINYSFSSSLSIAFAGLMLGVFAFSFFKSRISRLLIFIAIVGFIFSCDKNSGEELESKDGPAWIRIMQQDIDGRISYSEPVKVIIE